MKREGKRLRSTRDLVSETGPLPTGKFNPIKESEEKPQIIIGEIMGEPEGRYVICEGAPDGGCEVPGCRGKALCVLGLLRPVSSAVMLCDKHKEQITDFATAVEICHACESKRLVEFSDYISKHRKKVRTLKKTLEKYHKKN